MDKIHRFHTQGSYLLERLEHLAIVAVCSIVALYHLGDIAWPRFVIAFVAIDALGYLPGTIRWHRQGGGLIPPVYHLLYNITHSYLTIGVAVAVWAAIGGGLEWAMLAFPIHLSGDRSIFGNIYKPSMFSFEPVAPAGDPVPFDELMRARYAPHRDPTAAARARAATEPSALATAIDHPSGFLALNAKNQVFTQPGLPGLVSYRCHGRHAVIFGGVHAPSETRTALLDAFLAMAASSHLGVLAVQLRQDQIALFRARGFTVNQLGSSFGMPLAGYTLDGGKKMKLRNKIHRAQRAGLTVVEVGDGMPRDAATYAALDAISRAWLGAKHAKELDFMIGEVGTAQAEGREIDSLRRTFVVRDAELRAVGFITYVPSWGSRSGYLHDLTRKLPDAPAGAMELCNFHAIEKMQSEGVAHLHFGFTPFVTDGPEPEGANRVMAWLVKMLRAHGSAIYPAESQASYKLKWGPTIVESEYIAGRPISLRAAFDLLMLTRSL
jgi:phosphatidylglycerol lysyltransferase